VIALATTIITGGTLLKLVVAAVLAGVGVTIAFSLLIYCGERAATLRRADQRAAALMYRAASLVSLSLVLAIVAYGLILTTSKPK
jgi:hypothetical protein